MTEGPAPPNRRVRGITAIVLAVLAAVAMSIAVDSFWLQRNIFDTDGFVANASGLPMDPAVSTAVATAAADAVITSDGAAQIADALPDQLGFLTPVFSEFVYDLVFDVTKNLVESDAFTEVWTVITTAAHATAMKSLTGDGPADDIALDLDDGAALILTALEEAGITLFSDLEESLGEIVIVQAEALAGPRRLVDVFQTALWVFPVVALLLVAAAVFVDWDRPRTLQVFGLTLAGVMLINAVALGLAGNAVAGAAETSVGADAIRAVWDAFANGYLPLALAIGVLGLAAGIGGWWMRRTGADEDVAALPVG